MASACDCWSLKSKLRFSFSNCQNCETKKYLKIRFCCCVWKKKNGKKLKKVEKRKKKEIRVSKKVSWQIKKIIMIHHHSPLNFFDSHRAIMAMSNVDSMGGYEAIRSGLKSPSSTSAIKFSTSDNSGMMSSSEYHGTIQATICFDIASENCEKSSSSDIQKNYYTSSTNSNGSITPDHGKIHSSDSNFSSSSHPHHHNNHHHQVKILSTTEEPSSSIPDLGEWTIFPLPSNPVCRW